MYTNEDITIKANIKQNYLEVYSQCEKIQIKEKDSPVLHCASLRRIILRVISARALENGGFFLYDWTSPKR